MVPTQKLPHGSGLPSLNRVTDGSTEKSPKGRRSWPSGLDRAKRKTARFTTGIR